MSELHYSPPWCNVFAVRLWLLASCSCRFFFVWRCVGPDGCVYWQVVALVCVALLGSKLQPLLNSINERGALVEPNCALELSMFSENDRQDVVVGQRWFQVNRADKQCAGHCHRRLPSTFSDIAASLAISGTVNQIGRLPGSTVEHSRLCWLRNLYV